MGNHERQRARFTLVEMLVVIAVIAILSSLLLPALGNARNTARSVVCKGNFRQLSVALGAYENDFGGLPPAWSDPTFTGVPYGQSSSWCGRLYKAGLLAPYYVAGVSTNGDGSSYWGVTQKNCMLLRCPQAPTLFDYHYGFSYFLARRLGIAMSANYYSWSGASIRSEQISKPSSRALLGESTSWDFGRDLNAANNDATFPHGNNTGYPASSLTTGKALWSTWPPGARSNILYLDSHVDDMTCVQLCTNLGAVLTGWVE